MRVKNPVQFQNHSCQAGFSLVELLIVVVIMGILAAYVTYNLSTGATKLKTFVFNTKAHFHKARYEAIKRNRNVYIDFDFDGDSSIDNGYTIWADEDYDDVYTGGTDTIIEAIVFDGGGPSIYDNNPPIGAEPAGPDSSNIGDGVSAGGERFIMRPNGRSENGSVYLYLPKTATDNAIAAGPWAIIISTVGRIRVDEWRSNGWVVD
jgi:prepilin-type N-terminal cleavage/methylation domain-containing protein